MPTALIDTNILVYAYETHDAVRQTKSLTILTRLRETRSGYLSVKTLSEFFVVVRRIPSPLSTEDAYKELQKHLLVWPVLDLTPQIVLEAARGVRNYSFAYWDAQIWATAKLHGIDTVFSENMNAGSTVDGVKIINPLSVTFDLEAWLGGR